MNRTTISRAAALLLMMLLTTTAQTAWADSTFSGGSGSSADPYLIKTIDDLNQLATDVNGGTNYLDKYFRLENDLDFNDDATLKPTTAWDDATSQESNFTPIGNIYKNFCGYFDGQGYTIRGIRVYNTQSRQGLFGFIYTGAEVKNVALADARIAGGGFTGGIVGHSEGGSVTGCSVADNVAVVAISGYAFGGIVGYNNHATVSGCFSAVRISVATAAAGYKPYFCGGIAGENCSTSESAKATLTDNVVIGAVIPTANYNMHAAIAADDNSGTGSNNKHHVSYARNYYYLCTVAEAENVTNVGIATHKGTSTATIGDVNNDDNPDGAVYTLFYTLTLADGIKATATFTGTYDGKFYCKLGTTVTLSGQLPDPLPVGSIYDGYTVNGTAIDGNEFTMPAEDVTVTSIIVQCHTLTLTDGITTTATPTVTDDVTGTHYYRPGTPVTLSGRPAAEDGYVHLYTLNGSAIVGNTFTMPAVNATVALGERTNDWELFANGNSESTAYEIYTLEQFNLLAPRVNSGTTYEGKYFKLMNDLTFTPTTAWNDASSTENNHTAIGRYYDYNYYFFLGHFNGNNKTISGIRIYQKSIYNIGLFGAIGSGAEVKNITLTNAHILGENGVGGIVACNKGGTVSDCHVAADVNLHAVNQRAQYFGGVVGYNDSGTVSDCTSAVKITLEGDYSDMDAFCGIIGHNIQGTVENCRAIGAIVPAVERSGAIGNSGLSGTLRKNTYHSCLVGSNAFNIGVGKFNDPQHVNFKFIGDGDGALLDNSHFLLDDYMDAPALIAAYADPSNHTAYSGTVPDVSSLTATLQGRTLYKDGDWNTLCLPFAMTAEQVTAQLAPAALMTLSSSSVSGNTLTLNFTDATAIEAGKPYIIKWDGDGTNNLVNPVFSDVTISDASNPVTTDCVDFIGTYTPLSFTADDHTMLLVGTQNKLYYPQSGASLGICRAYFQLKNGLTAGDANSPAPGLNIQLNFGDDTTGIVEAEANSSSLFILHSSLSGWYTLSGTRLDKQPTQKGVYIHNGKKRVIK